MRRANIENGELPAYILFRYTMTGVKLLRNNKFNNIMIISSPSWGSTCISLSICIIMLTCWSFNAYHDKICAETHDKANQRRWAWKVIAALEQIKAQAEEGGDMNWAAEGEEGDEMRLTHERVRPILSFYRVRSFNQRTLQMGFYLEVNHSWAKAIPIDHPIHILKLLCCDGRRRQTSNVVVISI